MKDVDVVVIGAGPAGCTTARKVANAGFSVLIVDKRQELGAPIQCSGAVSRHALVENGIEPNPEYIHESVYGFRIMNGQGDETNIDYRKLKPDTYGEDGNLQPLGYVVDRRRFDRYLYTLAERAGAEGWLKAEATGYEKTGNDVVVTIRKFNAEKKVKAKVIVGADGLRSQVGKWAGLQTHIKLTELASCLQVIVDGVETDGLLELITGTQTAPGGYGWVFPKGGGYAEVGLGVIAPYTSKTAQEHLDDFLQNSFLAHRFKHAKVLEVQGGGVPLAAPLKRQFADNIILVGDAARHVNPITGGGIHTALSGGTVAANFLVDHLHRNRNHGASQMEKYQDDWLEAVGNQMWKLYDVKKQIFKNNDLQHRDKLLYDTMRNYFSPESEFKKV
ncbi:MAG: geranylgeranyl reductase family protein [Cryomorphaceae bacterium]|nr:NAD(P)/FAD-dependent oxidoreductase [Flavobacteriales bacterium]